MPEYVKVQGNAGGLAALMAECLRVIIVAPSQSGLIIRLL